MADPKIAAARAILSGGPVPPTPLTPQQSIGVTKMTTPAGTTPSGLAPGEPGRMVHGILSDNRPMRDPSISNDHKAPV